MSLLHGEGHQVASLVDRSIYNIGIYIVQFKVLVMNNCNRNIQASLMTRSVQCVLCENTKSLSIQNIDIYTMITRSVQSLLFEI